MKLYHAHIYPMDREPIENGWVSIQDGKITELGQGEIVPGPEDRDLAGGMLLPGFVDAHTHLGIIENGIGFEGDDCNEASDPFTPQLRAIDGINPMDRCFAEARHRGITAVLSSPGSANACGGQIAAIKTAGRRIDSMLIRTAGVKFALGETPKSVYNDRDETPITRMETWTHRNLTPSTRHCCPCSGENARLSSTATGRTICSPPCGLQRNFLWIRC